ncbi:MAG: DUF1249 domain-containing protein [Pseudohongiellaceae bacterium]
MSNLNRIQAIPKHKAIDLSARMAVCDANYIRILKLVPDFTINTRRSFYLPAVGAQTFPDQYVELMVIEAFRYTSTLSLTMAQPNLISPYYRPPNMLVRMYHDANTAEVVSYQEQWSQKIKLASDKIQLEQHDEKGQKNLFLAEWLHLCMETGLGQSTIFSNARTGSALLFTSKEQ